MKDQTLSIATLSLGVLLASSTVSADTASATLPQYQPAQQISGTLRAQGNDEMSALLQRWQEGFNKFHPGVEFQTTLNGSATGIYGLESRTADIALMGRGINPFERYGTYERSWIFPVEIEVATGSHETAHKTPAYAIFVHKDNPLGKLSMQQLDGIFGAQRSGGWDGLVWNTQAARGSEQNLRTWGQLGLKGSWAKQPIHVYSPPLLGAGAVTDFQRLVLKGGAMWNEDLREYPDRARMIADLGNDKYGIAYTALSYRTDAVKPLAISRDKSASAVPLDRASAANRTYPLARPVYLYFTIDNARGELAEPRVTPIVKEFVRYILSAQGQQAVASEDSYLPLTPTLAEKQLGKLESNQIPPEHKKRM